MTLSRAETKQTAMAKPSKLFYGWWIVIVGGILSLWGFGYQYYGFSALFKPMSQELGFSRAATSVASSIQTLKGGAEAPFAGWICDRFGPRRIMMFGLFVMGLGLVSMYFVHSLWMFYLAWGVLVGTGTNFALMIPVQTSIANWFVKKRGLASSVEWTISGLSGVAVLPFIAWMTQAHSWRMATLVGGLFIWGVGIPLTFFVIKPHRPEYYGLMPDGVKHTDSDDSAKLVDKGVKYAAEVQEVEFSLRQAMRTRAYWMMAVSRGMRGLGTSAITIHLIPFLTDTGITAMQAAGMYSFMIGMGIPFRLVGGFLCDRIGRSRLRFLNATAFGLEATGIGLYLLHPTFGMIWVWFTFYGIGNGMQHGIDSAFVARYFGRKAFGSINGVSTLLMMPITLAAPIYFGWIYDTTGRYTIAFTVVAIMGIIAAFIMSTITPPKAPKVTGLDKII